MAWNIFVCDETICVNGRVETLKALSILSIKKFLCASLYIVTEKKSRPAVFRDFQCAFLLLKRFCVHSLQLDHVIHNHVPKLYQCSLHEKQRLLIFSVAYR